MEVIQLTTTMKKILLSSCTALALACSPLASHAILIDFTTGGGYADGDLRGQDGWGFIFGTDPVLTVADAGGAGELFPTNTPGQGALSRTFSDAELGTAFDPNASIVTYSFVFEYTSLATLGTSTSAFQFRMGGAGGDEDLRVNLRFDGLPEIVSGDGSGFVFPVYAINTEQTITAVLDYATGTYEITGVGATPLSSGNLLAGAKLPVLRIDANNYADISLKSLEVTAVPEPTTAALMLGSIALLAYRRRR